MRAPNVPFTGTITDASGGSSDTHAASMAAVAGPVMKTTLCPSFAPRTKPQLRRRRATSSEKRASLWPISHRASAALTPGESMTGPGQSSTSAFPRATVRDVMAPYPRARACSAPPPAN